jgi:hypothetical protein
MLWSIEVSRQEDTFTLKDFSFLTDSALTVVSRSSESSDAFPDKFEDLDLPFLGSVITSKLLSEVFLNLEFLLQFSTVTLKHKTTIYLCCIK